jgi:hypothetical protein
LTEKPHRISKVHLKNRCISQEMQRFFSSVVCKSKLFAFTFDDLRASSRAYPPLPADRLRQSKISHRYFSFLLYHLRI